MKLVEYQIEHAKFNENLAKIKTNSLEKLIATIKKTISRKVLKNLQENSKNAIKNIKQNQKKIIAKRKVFELAIGYRKKLKLKSNFVLKSISLAKLNAIVIQVNYKKYLVRKKYKIFKDNISKLQKKILIRRTESLPTMIEPNKDMKGQYQSIDN